MSSKKAKVAARKQAGSGRPISPARRSTLDYGAELRNVTLGGRRREITNDEILLQAMITRALSGDKIRDARELLKRLDVEEDQGLADPVPVLSPYRKRKLMPAARDMVRLLRAIGQELIELGVAAVDREGKLIVSEAVHEAQRSRGL